jgi:hypothetical protein
VSQPELIRRQRIVETVAARFRGTDFAFGRADCVKLARAVLVAAGHKPPPVPRYTTLRGAKGALKRKGWANLAAMLDAVMPGRRIPPATMLPGDLAAMADEHGLGALVMNIGNGKVLGWSEGGGPLAVIVAHRIEAAWRV